MLREHEPLLRLIVFGLVLAVLAGLEFLRPRRRLDRPRLKRWPVNFGMLFFNSAVLRLVAPLGAVGIAFWAQERQLGLLHFAQWPGWLEFALGVVVLDLAIYGQHVLFHHAPPLWRLHRMHHSDIEVDVSTGNRFHLLEILLSLGIKALVLIACGIGPFAVLIFEIVLNAGSMFSHSNVRLPTPIDRVLRWLFVTPDMHRIHHSVYRYETDSNFGFNFSLWDRLFRTYRDSPADGHEQMRLGLEQFRDSRDQKFSRLLLQPFRPSDPE